MCASTRFPEAIPLIKAKTITKALTMLVLLLWVFLKQFSQSRDTIVFLIYFSKLCMKLNIKELKDNMKQPAAILVLPVLYYLQYWYYQYYNIHNTGNTVL